MTDDELRALVEQHHQLEELAKHPGWEVLTSYVLHGPAGSIGRQRRLVNRGAKDWDDYLHETGWLAGAHHVLEAREEVGKMVATERAAQAEAQETDE